MDINTLHRMEDEKEIGLNDIGRIAIRTTKPLFFDSYRRNRNTGSIILVDEATNETVAAGMISSYIYKNLANPFFYTLNLK